MSELKVLVVDDNTTNRLIATSLLQHGHAIKADAAKDGFEALDSLRREVYDVVLMDCHMPELDGYEATRALRRGEAGEANRDAPVIALTANFHEEDRQACLDAGMSDFIEKPLRPADLEKILARWAHARHPLSESGTN